MENQTKSNIFSGKIALALAFFTLVLLSLFFLFLQRASPIEKAVDEILEAIRQDEVFELYYGFVPLQLQRSTPLHRFKDSLSAQKPLFTHIDYTILKIEQKKKVASAHLELIDPEGGSSFFTMKLLRADDDWKLLSLNPSEKKERSKKKEPKETVASKSTPFDQLLDHIEALAEGKEEVALNSLSTSFQRALSKEAIAEHIKPLATLYLYPKTYRTDKENSDLIHVCFHTERQDFNISYTLTKEKESYRIESIEVQGDVAGSSLLATEIKKIKEDVSFGRFSDCYKRGSSQFHKVCDEGVFACFLSDQRPYLSKSRFSIEKVAYDGPVVRLLTRFEGDEGARFYEFSFHSEGNKLHAIAIKNL